MCVCVCVCVRARSITHKLVAPSAWVIKYADRVFSVQDMILNCILQ